MSVPRMKQDINGLCDAVRPFLARFLPIGDRRWRSGLLFHTPLTLLAVPGRRWKKRRGKCGRRPRSMSFANASRNKIFETRAGFGSRPFVVYPFLAIGLLFPSCDPSALVLSNLYIWFTFFSFPFQQQPTFADSSIGRESIVYRQEMHYIWQRFHSARLSLFSLGRFRRQCVAHIPQSFLHR